MKVIDLLNKIANGEIPEKIRYNDLLMTYDKKKLNYYDSFGAEIDWKYTCMQYLNDEVEIIEDTLKEDKKIEELSTWFAISDTSTLDGTCKYIDHNTEMFYDKINELVRKVNGKDNE